jgi:tetratricopeptide (TPR) repeat protein
MLGFVAVRQGEWAEVERQIGEALPIYRAQGDLAGEMRCVNILGINRFDQADFASALTHFEQALSLARQLGRRLFEANYLNNVANARLGLGDWAQAQAIYEQSLRVCQEIGHRDGEAFVFNNMGSLAIKTGDLERGQVLFQQALVVAREVGNRSEESNALVGLGWRYVLGGDYELARERCLEALQLAREIGSRAHEGESLTHLGHAQAGLGRLDEARESYRGALAAREALSLLDAALEARAGLARVALVQGDPSTGSGRDLPAALAAIGPIVEHLLPVLDAETHTDHGLEGADDPLWVWLTWYQVWQAAGDPRAVDVLARAHAILMAQADRLEDAEARRMYVENIPSQREIIATYVEISNQSPEP